MVEARAVKFCTKKEKERKRKEAYSSLCYEHRTAAKTHVTCHIGSYSITCHPADVTFPPLPQPIRAGTRFGDPRGTQG